jgi:hypothetical protein
MPSPLVVRCLIPSLLAAVAWWPSHAQAQVRRCTGPDGSPVYTDRPCEYIGAVERLPRAQVAARAGTRGGGGCARTVRELVYQLTAAFDGHDVNRLAGVAHWVGMSTQAAYRQMNRLDAIARQPLIDIVPVYPAMHVVVPEVQSAAPVSTADTAFPFRLGGHGEDVPNAEAPPAPQQASEDIYPQTTRNRPPVGLRIEQTLASGGTPSRTVFGLQRHLGCWWIRL